VSFLQAVTPVVENVALARDTYRLRLRCPELAARFRPGQFLMLRDPQVQNPVLGRAFALYDVVAEHGRPACVDLVYLVVGRMTRRMALMQPGDQVSVWGPLGNGFPDYTGVEHLIMVAGGIGMTPFLALAKQALGTAGYGGAHAKRQAEQVSFFYGARSATYLAGLDEFERLGFKLHIATDDGSRGHRGFVTDLLESQLSRSPDAGLRAHTSPDAILRASGLTTKLVGCGPDPMLHALATLARRRGLSCDLSLETPMACGVGICFSCVTRVQCEGGSDYRRVCIEGPVFDAAKLAW
jgi:dihydroorotate dehydrogenase electron transfer subunit